MMSTTTTTATATSLQLRTLEASPQPQDEDLQPHNLEQDERAQPGRTGWMVVVASSLIFFMYLGLTYSYGIVQLHLANAGLAPLPTLSFIGSISASLSPLCAMLVAHTRRKIGYRATAFVGSFLIGLGEFTASWATRSVAGMFITQGFIFGIGAGFCFLVSTFSYSFCISACGSAEKLTTKQPAATVSQLWFNKNKGVATGIVYGGAGLGACTISISLNKLIETVGLENAIRILGGSAWLVCLPAALLLKSPKTRRNPVSRFQWQLFRSRKFLLLLLMGAIATFPLFVPPFLLPLYAHSIGLSNALGALILAIWNLASAIGRVAMGLGADRFLGPINSMILALLITALSMLVLWPFSLTTGTVMVFAVLNGAGSGGFFSLMPVVTGQLFSSEIVANALSMLITSWTFGYFMGAPIAGYLLDAFGGKEGGVDAFRPPIFYAGSLSMFSAALLLLVRIMQDRKVFVRV